MTKPYTALAGSYDYLLRHVDYQGWYDFLRRVMLTYNPESEFVVELGCGTGRFGAKFSNDGFFILGIDLSAEMLRIARTRAYANYRIIRADIREFALANHPDFIFSVHDTMNYLTKTSDFLKALKNTARNMDEKSIFLFDLTTEYNIRKNFDGKKMHYKKYKSTIEWENTYDPDLAIVTSKLSFKEKYNPPETEVHLQRIYSREETEELIKQAGLELINVYGDFTEKPPHKRTVMSNYVVRRSL